jgi:carbon starvation protein
LLLPSLIALGTMYLTLVFGNSGPLGSINQAMASWSIITWVIVLLGYSYIASVLPVWMLLQPRDYINSLQLITALGLVVVGLITAGLIGGAPLASGGDRIPLEISAPMIRANPEGAPAVIPFLFITIACGACSGFHCLVSSGTSSKQIKCETDAQFVGYGSMLTEGFLATLVILACVAGLGLGATTATGEVVTGSAAYMARYETWASASGLAAKVGAFVDGSANFLQAMSVPSSVAVAIMGVLVASFAGTTLDTACRLQRYVIQELAATFGRPLAARDAGGDPSGAGQSGFSANPLFWLRNKHGATIFAVTLALVIAALPAPNTPVSLSQSISGQIPTSYLDSNPDLPDSATTGGFVGAMWWLTTFAGKGGLILWPLFGATNQLLAGLAFLVVSFFLWRRNVPVWFIVIPMIFMLAVPAWAMLADLPKWLAAEHRNWVVISVGVSTLLLEAWMLVEAAIIWPKVKGVVETVTAAQASGAGGPNC